MCERRDEQGEDQDISRERAVNGFVPYDTLLRQKRLLNAAANRVKPGGTLVYAVCSGEPEENEQVVSAFLKKRKDYELSPIRECFGLPMDRYLKTFPNGMNMDGFFAVRLQRKPS